MSRDFILLGKILKNKVLFLRYKKMGFDYILTPPNGGTPSCELGFSRPT